MSPLPFLPIHRCSYLGVGLVRTSALLSVAAWVSCARVETRTYRIVPHASPACPLPAEGTVQLSALGDSPSSPRSEELFEGPTSEMLSLSLETPSAAVMRLTSDRGSFVGVGFADSSDNLDLAMLPGEEACELGSLPFAAGKLQGVARTAFAGGTFFAGGEALPEEGGGSALANAFWLESRTGTLHEVSQGLFARRADASATPFAKGVLIAGGRDEQGRARSDAEVMSEEGVLDRDHIIALSAPRARHGALLLRTGETLLVGGQGEAGAALSSLELIDPLRGANRVVGLATLRYPRQNPSVLRLANGEVLVAGGQDGAGVEVPFLEWLAADGGPCVAPACAHGPVALVGRSGRAWVALVAGGALAVDPSRCEMDVCDPAAVWWVDENGAVDSLPPLSTTVTSPQLAAGEGGKPWLWDGRAFRAFDPWTQTFDPPWTPPSGPDALLPLVAPDGGLLVWVARGTSNPWSVWGRRHGTRNFLTRDTPLLLSDAALTVPSLPPRPGSLWFDRGGLHLSAESRVVVSDVTFRDFRLQVSTPLSVLPQVKVAGVTLGGAVCPWPRAVGSLLTIERTDRSLRLQVDGAASTCLGDDERTALELRGGAGAPETLVRDLVIQRVASPSR